MKQHLIDDLGLPAALGSYDRSNLADDTTKLVEETRSARTKEPLR